MNNKKYFVEIWTRLDPDMSDGFTAERIDYSFFNNLKNAKKWASRKIKNKNYYYRIILSSECN